MGFRFHRRFRILPGVYLNVSKTGGSVSFGDRGATLNLSKRGTRTTVGLPGSGMSWRSPTKSWSASATHPAAAPVSRVASQPAPSAEAPMLSLEVARAGRNHWRWAWIVIGVAIAGLYVFGRL